MLGKYNENDEFEHPGRPPTGEHPRELAGDFAQYCRPKLAALLESMRLDTTFESASGSFLYCRAEAPGEGQTAVLDLASGFGACLLGHNHPELKQALHEALDRDTPMLAQASVRDGAGRLARRLNELIPTDGRYLCTFTNSGAESVEAALKHAYKVRFDAIRRTYEGICREIGDLVALVEEQGLEVTLPHGRSDLQKYRDDIDERNLAQFECFRSRPVALALKGSFHGKTSSALKVTFNKSFREGYEGLSAIEPVFVDPRDVARLPEIVADAHIELLVPRLEGNRVVLEPRRLTRVMVLLFEIVMGEGGILVLPDETLETLAELHPDLGVPYLIDEIQTGCGRTGSMFAWSSTALAAIEPEYVTLSKALGGGLVKLGVAMIHERIYDADFGILHTSTFAEDDLSCAVSMRVLDLLTADHGALMQEVTRKGVYLLEALGRLAARHPDIVREVRGRGLMIGVEFEQLQDRGPFFRYAGKQGFLSLLLTSYLLHHHHIRVLAPLTTLLKGNPGKCRRSILRIQPPVTATYSELDRAVDALDEVLNLIAHDDEYLLVAHLLGEETNPEARRCPEQVPISRPPSSCREDFDARIGFVLHPTTLPFLVEYYFPSFADRSWDPERLTRWWRSLSRFLEPEVVHTTYLVQDDFAVEANFVAVPWLPAHMMEVYNGAMAGDPAARELLVEMQDKIQDAVTVARELGDDAVPTSVVGLGAYTSIVTHQGETLNDYEIPVTTGNAYTAGLMLQAIERAAELNELDPASTTAAVVGAAGNIGSVLAAMLCQQASHLRLVGRDHNDGRRRLDRIRQGCMRHILELVSESLDRGVPAGEIELGGLAGIITDRVIRPCLLLDPPPEDLRALREVLVTDAPLTRRQGALLDEVVVRRLGSASNPLITLHTDVSAIGDCDIVALATSSTNSRLVSPDNVRPGAIVCSASVPSDISDAFLDQLDDYFVFDGGFASLPNDNAIDWVGMPGGGQAFGCLSETLLMGLDGHAQSFAKGILSTAQVRAILELAETYGFSLGAFRLDQTIHPRSPRRTP